MFPKITIEETVLLEWENAAEILEIFTPIGVNVTFGFQFKVNYSHWLKNKKDLQ